MEEHHTNLTFRNFSSYAAFAFAIGLVTVGFGATDLLMVGVLGITHVAAVGQGDLIVTCILAATVGVVDVFTARLAAAEGVGDRDMRQIGLAAGFLCAVVQCTVLALAVGELVRPALVMFRQVDELIDPISAYVIHRLFGTAPFLIYMAASEALKITGLRTHALHILLLGFVANALLNAMFLYTRASEFFDSPEAAVAVATVFVHVSMGVIAVQIWIGHLRVAGTDKRAEIWISARQHFAMLLRTAPGVGARILNDYAGTVVPILFIGTLSTSAVAATAVATKIYAVFCRVPQAAFAACYVYYSYGIEARGKQPDSEQTRQIPQADGIRGHADSVRICRDACDLVLARAILQWGQHRRVPRSKPVARVHALRAVLFLRAVLRRAAGGPRAPAFCSARQPQPRT